jgi:hypothetical protein
MSLAAKSLLVLIMATAVFSMIYISPVSSAVFVVILLGILGET